jgi:hypothetical protein
MVSGLLIGVWQFYLSFRVSMLVLNWHHSAKGSDPQGATLSELKDLLSSNLEFSKNGLKIASPIVGIIGLGLSIVFLWVFAKEIYPIVH